jgi:hypothetical protein
LRISERSMNTPRKKRILLPARSLIFSCSNAPIGF